MFSSSEKRAISAAVQQILRNTQNPELPKYREIQFSLHIESADRLTFATILNNDRIVRSIEPPTKGDET